MLEHTKRLVMFLTAVCLFVIINVQVVETSVTKNTSFQSYPHSNDHTIGTAKIVTLCAKNGFLKTIGVSLSLVFQRPRY